MNKTIVKIATVAAAAALICVPAAAAQAKSAPVPHAASVFGGHHLSKAAVAHLKSLGNHTKDVSNELLDSDIVIFVANRHGLGYPAEGHLKLHLKSGSTTSYTGTFTDNLADGKSYKASGKNVDSGDDAGVYTIKTHKGTFVVPVDAAGAHLNGGKTPKSFGKSAYSAIDQFLPHEQIVNAPFGAYLEFSALNLEPVVQITSGVLTTDALAYVVPNSSKHHVNSTLRYRDYAGSSTKTKTYKVTEGQYFSADGSDNGFITIGAKFSGRNFVIDAVENDSDTGGDYTNPYDGSAYSGTASHPKVIQFFGGLLSNETP